jgi:hypothetical protein
MIKTTEFIGAAFAQISATGINRVPRMAADAVSDHQRIE